LFIGLKSHFSVAVGLQTHRYRKIKFDSIKLIVNDLQINKFLVG